MSAQAAERPRRPRERLRHALRSMPRLYRSVMTFLTVSFYGVMGPFGYAAFTLLSLAPTRNPVRRALRLQWVMRTAFGMLHRWMKLSRVRDCGPSITPQLPEGPFIVVSNHPALDDGLTVMSAVPRVCTAVNRTTYNRWWLQPLLKGAGQFCGGARNILGSGEVIDSAIERLRQGFRVLVFPEAHRSFTGGLRPFARGAFEIACKANVQIVPILIRADPLWMGPGTNLLAFPMQMPKKTLEVLQPLHPSDFGGDSRQMRDYAEAMYRRRLGLTPRADANQPRSMTP